MGSKYLLVQQKHACMNPISSRLLVSSTLLSFSLGFSVYAANVDLKESFNGSDGGTFTPKATTDAQGTTYTLLNDISIYSAGNTTTPLTSSCFNDTAGDLTFLGEGYSLIFNTINAGTNPGAIDVEGADKTLSLQDFSYLSFIASPASTTTNGTGAVVSKGALTIKDSSYLLALQNFSTNEGGAFNSKGCTLSGISGYATFQGNSSSKAGGALYSSGDLSITNNSGPILFTQNSAKETGGGAIASSSTTTISNNGSIVFSQNTATGTTANGGAISCTTTTAGGGGGGGGGGGAQTTPELTLNGNASVTFSNNTAEGNGGAVYANVLSLESNGEVSFFNNTSGNTTTAGKGGAIAIADSGTLSLSADKGNIIFNGNTVIATGNSPTTTHNAINLASTATIKALRASSGNSIFFYDPITNDPAGNPPNPPATPLVLNEASNSQSYSGSIVFSGEKLSETETSQAANLTSTINQPATLASGSLVLKSGVTTKFSGFTQDPNAFVVMDAGTTLETTAEDLSLTRLNINVDSLDGTKKVTVKTSGSNKNVTISGPISLVDAQGNFYESHNLQNPQVYSLLDVTANGTGTATVATIPTKITPAEHYGYQGYWSLAWTLSGTTQSAKATWTQTGYTPNPERKTALVPNSLWGNAIDIRSLHKLMKNHTEDTSVYQHFWVSGIANFFHQDRRDSRQGFRHLSGGCVVGINALMPSEDLLSLAYCQLSGRDKDHVVTKNYSDIYGTTLHYQHTASLFNILDTFWGQAQTPPKILSLISPSQHVVFDAHLTYTHADNHVKTLYSSLPMVKGSWRNNNFGIECGAALAAEALSSLQKISYAPFIHLQYFYGRQQRFQEMSSPESRYFEPNELINFAIPIGITFERTSKITPSKQSLTFTYSVDAYRKNPEGLVGLVASDASWTVLGANLARQAISAQLSNHFLFNPFFETFYQCAFEFRGSSRLYNFDIGTSFVF
ncbi:polymorphic outer membrane protein middle domain-containing protein [Chlamydia pecorum]|uniref:polymorphic outer membrane protein middle domain-containing protein n=1 Tax=Chlamydia pecorum TaxID=85991 RepID=UPI0007B2B7F0|nr:polymorphic outer membrane protein middle domain-containing protein [Chlamydia pecorum]KZN26810.1 autotransporter beta-domain protein [Chlamydia pecorum]